MHTAVSWMRSIRFTAGIMWGDATFAPPTAIAGQPLPYSLIAPAALLLLATTLGLVRLLCAVAFLRALAVCLAESSAVVLGSVWGPCGRFLQSAAYSL